MDSGNELLTYLWSFFLSHSTKGWTIPCGHWNGIMQNKGPIKIVYSISYTRKSPDFTYQIRPNISFNLQSTISVESMLTRVTPSRSKNSKAMDTFSNFWDLNVGFLLCLGIRFPDNTSIRVINFKPSDNSVSRSLIWNNYISYYYLFGYQLRPW